MKKRNYALLVPSWVLVLLFAITSQAQENEPNDTFANADLVILNEYLDATLSSTDTVDIFKFEADSTKMYTLNSMAPDRDLNLKGFFDVHVFFEDDLDNPVVSDTRTRYDGWGFRLSGWVPPRTGTYFARVVTQEVPTEEAGYQIRLGYGTNVSVAASTHEPDNTVAEAELLAPTPANGSRMNNYLYNNYSDTSVTDINWNDIDYHKFWGEAGTQLIAETFTAGPDSLIRDLDTEIFLHDSAGVELVGNDDKPDTPDDPWELILGRGIGNTFSRLDVGPLPYTGWYYVRVNAYYNSITRSQSPTIHPYNPGGGEYELQIRLEGATMEIEPNNTFATASPVALNENLDATLSSTDTVDVFKFEADSTKMYTLNSIAPDRDLNLKGFFDVHVFFEDDLDNPVVSDTRTRYDGWGFRLSGWVPPRTGTYFARVVTKEVPTEEAGYQVRLGYGTAVSVAASTHEPDNTVAEAELLAPTPTDGSRMNNYLYNNYSDTSVTDINWNDIDYHKFWGEAGTQLIAETFTAGPDSLIRDLDTEIFLHDSAGVELVGNDDKPDTPDDPWELILGRGIGNTFSRLDVGPLPYTGWYYVRVNAYYNSITRSQSPTIHPYNPGGGEYELQIRLQAATEEIEPNDSFATASRVDLNMPLDATLSSTDTVDVFKFEADSTKMYTLNSMAPDRDLNLKGFFDVHVFFEDDLENPVVSDTRTRYDGWGFRLSGWVPPRTGTYFARVVTKEVPTEEAGYQVRLGYGTAVSVAASTHEPDNTVAEAELLAPISTDGTKVNGYLYNNYSDTSVTDINWNDIDYHKFWGEAGQRVITETFTAGPDSLIRDLDTEIFLHDSAGVELVGNDDKDDTPDDPWELILGRGIGNTFSRLDVGPLPYTGWYYVRVNAYYNSITRSQSPTIHPYNPGGGEYLISVQLSAGQESEPNNTFDNASMVVRDALINATLSSTDTVDVFRFYADSTRMYTLNSIAPDRDLNLKGFFDVHVFFEDDLENPVVSDTRTRYDGWGFRLSGWVPPRTGTYFARVVTKEVPTEEAGYQVRLGYGTLVSIAASTHEPDNSIAEAAALGDTPTTGERISGYLYNNYSDTLVTDINWNDFDYFKFQGEDGAQLIAETFTAGPDSLIRDLDTEIFLYDSAGVELVGNDDKPDTPDDPWEQILGRGIGNTFSRLDVGPLPYTGTYYLRVNAYYNSISRSQSPTIHPYNPGGGEYELQIRLDAATSVAEDGSTGLPETFDLVQNYPNPFNPETTIRYQVPHDSEVKITVFNMLGQKIVTLVDKKQAAGRYSIVWDGTSSRGVPVSSGVYFYRMQAEDFVKTVKMLLLK